MSNAVKIPFKAVVSIQQHLFLQLRLLVTMLVVTVLTSSAYAQTKDHPFYKPSSRAPETIDILSNPYGASRSAPDALAIGDVAPNFSAPKVGGGTVSLRQLKRHGDTVLIFYRGHW